MFSPSQRDDVRQAFARAGYSGRIVTAPVSNEDERVFLVDGPDLAALEDLRALEERLQSILRRKVWVVERTAQWSESVPFR